MNWSLCYFQSKEQFWYKTHRGILSAHESNKMYIALHYLHLCRCWYWHSCTKRYLHVCMGVERGGRGLNSLELEIRQFPINFLIEMYFSLSFVVVEMKFHYCWPPWKKSFWRPGMHVHGDNCNYVHGDRVTLTYIKICCYANRSSLSRLVTLTSVVPKPVRTVTQIIVAIMFYYPRYFASWKE